MRRTAPLIALTLLVAQPCIARDAAARAGDPPAGSDATAGTAGSGTTVDHAAPNTGGADAGGETTTKPATPGGSAASGAATNGAAANGAAANGSAANGGAGSGTTAPPGAPTAATTGSAPSTIPGATSGAANTAAHSGPALAPAALAVRAGTYKLDPDHGKITWSVNHLGFSTYTGQFAGVTADLTIDPHALGRTTLSATIDLASVDTLNPKLNDHLKGDGFFDTGKFPQAVFKSTSVTPTGPRSARIDGTLTLHDHTAPVVISATFNNAGVDPVDKRYTIGFDAASIIRRSNYGVSEYVPLIGDDVLLTIEGEFKPAS